MEEWAGSHCGPFRQLRYFPSKTSVCIVNDYFGIRIMEFPLKKVAGMIINSFYGVESFIYLLYMIIYNKYILFLEQL